ncbi:unnamed protein product [Clonostachys rosea f. rosea IK726]|jgi:hypothetical protein|uniref:CREG-like beta-barrel domain-containing protein n=2 Tax=Bionectria ochroleuca TaxID=29856 RepID=A0A0B7K0F7_BIOOC|nr:unnamed protein product [Clonostachys rosea f. rosea IK726]
MKLTSVTAALTGAAAVLAVPSPAKPDHAEVAKIPTSYESAVMGRRVLALSKLATFSTVFPNAPSAYDDNAFTKSPSGLEGLPIGLMDYVADCEDEGNPTILAITIGTSFRNAAAGSNLTLSMRWAPPYPPLKRMSLMSRVKSYFFSPPSDGLTAPDTVPYSAANLPRFSLVGYLEYFEPDPIESVRLAACYTSKHHDAKWWLPGNVIHESKWARLVVTHIYWIGGFGDRAYIGWIPLEEWKKVTKEEWSSIELPGEKKGWGEWSVDNIMEL